MKSSSSNQSIIHSVSIDRNARWSIYHRLQELDIPCICSTNKPLEVQLDYPNAIAQLCSVVKHSTASRDELIDWLDDCWKIKSKSRKANAEFKN